jgi:hypothetical protein
MDMHIIPPAEAGEHRGPLILPTLECYPSYLW